MHAATLEGYANRTSYLPGEIVEFKVNSTFPAFDYSIVRATGVGRFDTLATAKNVRSVLQMISYLASERGCDWATAFSWMVPRDAPSGYYAAIIYVINQQSFTIPFIVRPPHTAPRAAALAVLASTNTWNAYNQWGGKSLYANKIDRQPAYFVGSERPNPQLTFYPVEFSALLPGELYLIEWLHDHCLPYEVYADIDLHREVQLLNGYRILALNTHSEYWSQPMREHLESFLLGGGSLLSLSGNSIYYRVSWDAANKIMECRKDGTMHTQDGEAGGLWSRLGQPEETTLGVAYSDDGFLTFAPYQVSNASHWLFADTGVRNGDLIGVRGRNGAASGHETDKPSLQSPPNLIVLARGLNPGGLPSGRGRVHYPQPPLQWNGEGGAAMSYYDHPGGGGVFAAGSVAFTGSLVEDAVLSRVVANFIERFARSPQRGYQPPQNFQISLLCRLLRLINDHGYNLWKSAFYSFAQPHTHALCLLWNDSVDDHFRGRLQFLAEVEKLL